MQKNTFFFLTIMLFSQSDTLGRGSLTYGLLSGLFRNAELLIMVRQSSRKYQVFRCRRLNIASIVPVYDIPTMETSLMVLAVRRYGREAVKCR